MDAGSFVSLATSLKAAFDLVKGAVDVRDHTKFQGLLGELQDKIISAQQSALAANTDLIAMQQRIGELERKLARVEEWRTEKMRYELADFGSETFAYRLKQDDANGQPQHLLCPSCFAKGQKSILQSRGTSVTGQNIMRCTPCNETIYLGGRRRSNVDRGGSGWTG